MGKFFAELKRRNVAKVGVAYAVLAWLLIQIANEAFPALLLPDWTMTLVVVLLVLGFPVALVLAWALELTPEGVRVDKTAAAANESESSGLLNKGFRVGEWTVEPLRGRIVSGANREHLEPRIMEVLVCLANDAGEVVERDVLLRRVWGERAVTDEPLTRCIAELRRALGDTRKNPKYIQTIPKRGYRMVATVSWPNARTDRGALLRRGALGWFAAAGLLSLVLYWLSSDEQTPPLPIEGVSTTSNAGPPSVAVLPLSNRSNDPDMEFFSVGVTEDIINLLATIPDLRVTSRTSSFYFHDKNLDLKTIATELNVQTVLEGSVRRQEDEIRVIVQLIDVETDTQIDAFRFDRQIGDLFDVQDEIATAVANRLRVSLGRIPERGAPTRNMQAHMLYLKARYESRQRTAASMNNGIELLEEAIRLDPDFAAAHEELATILMTIPGYSQRPNDRVEVTLPKAIAAARRANELDPMLSKPYAILAALSFFEMDYVAARNGVERALALSPNDPEIRIWFGMFLSGVGNLELAFEQFTWAHRVDPLAGLTNGWMGIVLRRLGRDSEAIPYLDTAIELGYINARPPRALEHIENAEFDAAHQLMSVWSRYQGIDPEWARVYLAAIKNPERRYAAIEWIEKLEKTHRDIGPTTYAEIGALDEAYASADAAVETLSATFFWDLSNRSMREFRRDPRFPDLVRKTGLVDYWNTYGWNGYCQLEDRQIRCN